MNLKDLNDQQRKALLDLAMLAMYSDGHLASAEDERVHRLLGAMGYDEESARNREYDAAVARVSRHAGTAAGARGHESWHRQRVEISFGLRTCFSAGACRLPLCSARLDEYAAR